MADPEKILDELNRTVDATRKPFAVVRDVAIGVASAITMLPKALWSLWRRRDKDT